MSSGVFRPPWRFLPINPAPQGPVATLTKLTNNYTLTANAGSFALSGQAATLKAGRVLISAAGSFALTGQAATLYRAITLTAGAGSFTLSGQAASLVSGRVLSAAAGAFTVSGQAAGLTSGRVLSAAVGSYTLTGQAATLLRTGSYSLTCSVGAFTLSGQAAGLAATRTLAGAAGAYALSGNAAGLTTGRVLTASAGAYTLIGQAAALTYTPNAVAYTLAADTGAFTLNGQDAALAYAANDQTPTGGGWIEEPDVRTARKERERKRHDAWKRLERDIEDAYAKATGQTRKDVRPVVREALAPRDPERVRAIAEQLVSSGDTRAADLAQRIETRLAEIAQLAAFVEQAQQIAAQQRAIDEENAIIALLLAA